MNLMFNTHPHNTDFKSVVDKLKAELTQLHKKNQELENRLASFAFPQNAHQATKMVSPPKHKNSFRIHSVLSLSFEPAYTDTSPVSAFSEKFSFRFNDQESPFSPMARSPSYSERVPEFQCPNIVKSQYFCVSTVNKSAKQQSRSCWTRATNNSELAEKVSECLQKCLEARSNAIKRSQTHANYNKMQDILSRLEYEYGNVVSHAQVYESSLNQIYRLINPTDPNPLIPHGASKDAMEDDLQELMVLIEEQNAETYGLQLARNKFEDELKKLKRDLGRACNKLAKVTESNSKDIVNQVKLIVKSLPTSSSKAECASVASGQLQKKDSKLDNRSVESDEGRKELVKMHA